MNITRNTAHDARVLVLFDGGCPLCRREIAHYRRLDRAARVYWVDITAPATPPEAFGIDLGEALSLFHVRDVAGRWQIGAYGFVTLWEALPYYRHAGRLIRRLRLTGILDRAYRRFARWRFARRCDEGCRLS
jgi:predicted DCC family thiol-disulfide oxidoreductase YuxK